MKTNKNHLTINGKTLEIKTCKIPAFGFCIAFENKTIDIIVPFYHVSFKICISEIKIIKQFKTY